MHAILARRRLGIGAAMALVLVVPSCGGPSMNPSTDRARPAPESALNAWLAGKPPGLIEGTDPPVQAVDNDWTNRRKLAAFAIVGERPSESDKRFDVRLTFASPPAEVNAVYVVLGASPIAVFREEDYARTLNMDNNPTPAKKRR